MYNNIGLRTPRGSGTNGYIQRNMSFINPVFQKQRASLTASLGKSSSMAETGATEAPTTKKADEGILEHKRKRQIELQLATWMSKNGLEWEKCVLWPFFFAFVFTVPGLAMPMLNLYNRNERN